MMGKFLIPLKEASNSEEEQRSGTLSQPKLLDIARGTILVQVQIFAICISFFMKASYHHYSAVVASKYCSLLHVPSGEHVLW